jgi:RNA polymerase sigma-70 factor (ECF subfamily)
MEREVRAGMADLSSLERTAFVLRHFDGRSIAEICARLSVSPSAGKQAIFRAVDSGHTETDDRGLRVMAQCPPD